MNLASEGPVSSHSQKELERGLYVSVVRNIPLVRFLTQGRPEFHVVSMKQSSESVLSKDNGCFMLQI